MCAFALATGYRSLAFIGHVPSCAVVVKRRAASVAPRTICDSVTLNSNLKPLVTQAYHVIVQPVERLNTATPDRFSVQMARLVKHSLL